jgi:RNA polymerase sigma-70 factor (ECF subfamily)
MSDDQLDTLFLRDIYQRLGTGDPDARNELLLRASGRLERLARKMLHGYPGVRRWEDTSDVLQAALMKLMRALDTVQPGSTRDFIGLAAEQIRRVLIDLARHYQGPRGHAANHASGVLRRANESELRVLEPVDAAIPPTDELDKWCSFHEAVEQLPVMEREVFGLSFYHGWKQRDIADLLQVSDRTVRRFWHQACDELREALGETLPID